MKRVCINLSKSDVRTPWGFRIQGGRDFNRPLIISRITCQSIADVAGLQCGDNLVMINGTVTTAMVHQEAQEKIVRSGTSLNLEVVRELSPSTVSNQPCTDHRSNAIQAQRSNGVGTARKGAVQDIQMSHSSYDLKYRSPICQACKIEIRGPFVILMESCFCPGHCLCCYCKTDLTKTSFVEIDGQFYCEHDYAQNMAPNCYKCNAPVIENEVTAMDHKWHHHCFTCNHCNCYLGSALFKVGDDSLPYCERDWNDLFQAKCARCSQPITIADQFVEVNSNSFHTRCFCCSACKMSLVGKHYHNRNGKPFCKTHAFAGVLF